MSLTLEQIFNVEERMEKAFKSVLSAACPNVYDSRETRTAVSPRIEIKYMSGAVLEHRHLFPDGTMCFDAMEGTLEVSVVTNRTSSAPDNDHRKLIAAVRRKMQLQYLQQILLPIEPVWRIDDIREQGTVESEQDIDDLDFTTFQHYMVINVNADPNGEIWPATML